MPGCKEPRWWVTMRTGSKIWERQRGLGWVGCVQDRAGWPCIRHIHYWSAEGKQTCALKEMGDLKTPSVDPFLFNCETFPARACCGATWTQPYNNHTSATYTFRSFSLSCLFLARGNLSLLSQAEVRLACHQKKKLNKNNKLPCTDGCATALFFYSEESKHRVVNYFCYLHGPGSARSQAVPCVKTFCFLKCALSSSRRYEWVVVDYGGFVTQPGC